MNIDLFLVGGVFGSTASAHALRHMTDYAVAAEAAGFDAVWLAEHHFISYGACPSATVVAGNILGRTSRLHVGSAACVLSNRHPVALGEEAVTLDALSGGRFRLGVARGGPWVDLEVFGTGLERFEHGFAESVDLLLAWLSGRDRVDGRSHSFRFRPVAVVPLPPRPVPVWVAATSETTVDIAARRGLPLLLGVHATDDEKAALLDRYTDVTAAYGHDPHVAEHAAVYLAHAADNHAEARRALREPMTAWLTRGVGEYVRLDGRTGPGRDHRAYVDRLIDTHLVGPPEDSAKRLADSAARLGIRRALLLVEGSGEVRSVTQNIARLGAELIPLVGR